MNLNIEQQYRVEQIFLLANENQNLLNRFERNFLKDNEDRYIRDDGGPTSDTGYFVSFKMWRILFSIEMRLGLQ